MLITEMGLLIESTEMAEAIHAIFDKGLNDLAWRVEMRNRKPVWIDTANGTETYKEPGSSGFERLTLKIVGWLPVEWLS